MAQVREAATILDQGFGEVFDQAKRDVQRWKKYFVSGHQKIVDNVVESTLKIFHILKL